MRFRSMLACAFAAAALQASAAVANRASASSSATRWKTSPSHHAQRRPGAPVHRGSREVSRHARKDARQARAEERGADPHRDRQRHRVGEVPGAPPEHRGLVPARTLRQRHGDGRRRRAWRGAARHLSRVHALLPGVAVRRRVSAVVQRRPRRAHGFREVRPRHGDHAGAHVPRVRGARRRLDSVRAADPRRPLLAGVPVAQAREFVLLRRPGSPCTTAWWRTASSANRCSST